MVAGIGNLGKWNNSSTTDALFSMQYNQNKIASNSAVGTFSYNHSTKPHALTNVELYNEETISLNTCSTTYTPYNKVKTISEENSNYHYEIGYYPNKNQAISILTEDGNIISEKHYAGKAFEYESVSNTLYHYVYANGRPIAVFIQAGEGDLVPYFIHTDRLGSVDVITDIDGNIVDSMDFDAWGNRRDRLDWTEKEGNITHLIDRGFTFHQHLNVFNLINMGGRVYDPVVGQFLSPDPYVQAPDNTQNMNRYAYCINSPLMYTDPTGEKMKWWGWLLVGLGLFDPASAIATATTAASTIAAIAGTAAVTTYPLTALTSLIFIPKNGNSGDMNRVRNAWRINNGLFVTDKNKNFLGRIWEFTSRNSWEVLQTIAGYAYTQGRNIGGNVDRVDYLGGATFATRENHSGASVSLGNYININIDNEITGGFQDRVLSDPLFMHEYGHRRDSKIFGPTYLFAVGIPSAISASKSISIKGEAYSTHDIFWTETRANRSAKQYFGKYYGVDWDRTSPYYPGGIMRLDVTTNTWYYYSYTIEDNFPTK